MLPAPHHGGHIGYHRLQEVRPRPGTGRGRHPLGAHWTAPTAAPAKAPARATCPQLSTSIKWYGHNRAKLQKMIDERGSCSGHHGRAPRRHLRLGQHRRQERRLRRHPRLGAAARQDPAARRLAGHQPLADRGRRPRAHQGLRHRRPGRPPAAHRRRNRLRRRDHGDPRTRPGPERGTRPSPAMEPPPYGARIRLGAPAVRRSAARHAHRVRQERPRREPRRARRHRADRRHPHDSRATSATTTSSGPHPHAEEAGFDVYIVSASAETAGPSLGAPVSASTAAHTIGIRSLVRRRPAHHRRPGLRRRQGRPRRGHARTSTASAAGSTRRSSRSRAPRPGSSRTRPTAPPSRRATPTPT